MDSVEVVGTEVKVTMSIENSIPVPKDVSALIAPQSLIGERYIALSPAWRQGVEKAPDGMEIRNTPDHPDRVIIPVEPDEALAELKKFIDALDPQGLGKLISNLSDDLKGQGPTLNHALDQVSQIVVTFADKDQQLANIVDHFDKFTATLTTRETQLGDILSTFAQATQVLADERQSLENLLGGLADLSRDGLTLVAKHSQQLKTDLETLTRLAQSIDVNLEHARAAPRLRADPRVGDPERLQPGTASLQSARELWSCRRRSPRPALGVPLRSRRDTAVDLHPCAAGVPRHHRSGEGFAGDDRRLRIPRPR